MCVSLILAFPILVLLYVHVTSTQDETLYDLLGVASSASKAQIKRAYHKLAMKLHPDKVRDTQRKEASEALFKRVAEAHETLSDESKRELYDASLGGLNPTVNDPIAEEQAYPDDVRPPDDPPPPTWVELVRAWLVHSDEARLAGRCGGAILTLLAVWRLLRPRLRSMQSDWAARAVLREEAAAAEAASRRGVEAAKHPKRASLKAESEGPTLRTCRFCDIVLEDEALIAAHVGGKRHLKLAALAGASGEAVQNCWVWRVATRKPEGEAQPMARESLYTGPHSLPPAPVVSQAGAGKRGSGKWNKVKSR